MRAVSYAGVRIALSAVAPGPLTYPLIVEGQPSFAAERAADGGYVARVTWPMMVASIAGLMPLVTIPVHDEPAPRAGYPIVDLARRASRVRPERVFRNDWPTSGPGWPE